MKAVALDGLLSSAGARPQRPLYFSSGDHQLFGWLHESATGPAPQLGLLICKPFGYEAICAHRSVRAFAEAAAAIGVPALRFDYRGTGDAEDIEPTAEQLTPWTADVLAAIEELRRQTGVERVALLGFRLGALVATVAAAQARGIAGLAVVAPVVSGRRYLREQRIIQMAAARVAVVAPTAVASPAELAASAAFEFSGFTMSRATTNALAQLDLMTLASAPAPEVLLIDRSDLPGARAWSDALSRLGAHTQYSCLPGAVEMLWTAAHFASVPQAMIETTLRWLGTLGGSSAPAATARRSGAPPAGFSSTTLCLPVPGGKRLTERPVFFGPEQCLFGMVTEPDSGELRRRGVVLLNDAATYHIGSNRLYVALARRWARRGYVVLRMDLGGLGDSATPPGRSENEVFPQGAVEDMRAAIELLRTRYGVRDVTLGGLCSGAYHALRGAVAGLPLSRVLMVNPQNFFWRQGTELTDLQEAEVVRNPAVYRDRVLSVTSWMRLLTGRVNVWRIVQIYVHRLWILVESLLRDLARRLRIRLPRDLGWELEELARRGVQVVFVFAEGEAGLELLKLQAGSAVRKLGARCRVHVVPGADHIFSQSGPRQALESILSEELFARSPPEAALPAEAVTRT